LFPLLFNLVIDVFTGMLVKASKKGHNTGLMNSMCPEGIVSLQYADDTLLFLDHDYKAGCYMKWLLVCFEKFSVMKINYSKCDLTTINLVEEESNNYAKIFCCKIGKFSFKYLACPSILISSEGRISNLLLIRSLSGYQDGKANSCLMELG
jgi:hypothetical protein